MGEQGRIVKAGVRTPTVHGQLIKYLPYSPILSFGETGGGHGHQPGKHDDGARRDQGSD